MEAPEYPAMAGVFAVALRRNLPKVVGPEAFEHTLAALSEEHRLELEGTTSLGWASLAMVSAVVEAAAAVTKRDPLEVNASITRLNMDMTIRGVWRLMLKAVTDRMIIQRAPALYTRAYNRGDVSSEWVARGHARLRIEKWPDINEYALRSGGVALEALLEHAGRSDVQTAFERTDDGASLEARWR